MVGGRTRQKQHQSLHFAPKRTRRSPARTIAVVIVVVLVVLVAAVAKAAATAVPRLTVHRLVASSVVIGGTAPSPAWPAGGEAAVEVQGLPSLGSSGGRTPQPIASLAKIMTAYVVLRDHPITTGQNGFTVTITAADVDDYNNRAAQAQSVVAVVQGETLTELQLLQGLLVASGNNLAAVLADYDAGSQTAFVAKMNATAKSLGMTHTTYTDPSGLASTTVSTAGDQLILAAKAMADPVFARVVAMTSVDLPDAGTLSNFNTAVGANGYVGIKTGSDSTAGGCLVFANHKTVDGRSYTILGAVLGQDAGQQSTQTLIAAAVRAANALVQSVARSVSVQTILPAQSEVAVVKNAQGATVPITTSQPLSVLGYGGMTVPLTVELSQVGTKLPAGQKVAVVSAAGGASVAATASRTMPSVAFSWKLLHDY